MAEQPDRGVLLIYTGGTIGSLNKDPNDPLSPLEPKPLEEVLQLVPRYDKHHSEIILKKSRIKIGTVPFDPPLDSSNIQPHDWVKMAEIIRDNYNRYEGFVLLHGTDTLAYTASALAFMLDNLSKPVIITGSQRPIGESRSDAVQNLITSIEIAAARSLGSTVVPEVCVFFRDSLLRGCRTTKLSASSYGAFDSPNMKPLGMAGEHIVIDDAIIRQPSTQRLHVRTQIDPHVAVIDVFPGIQPELLRTICTNTDTEKANTLRGIVLQTFGTGNAPSHPKFLEPIGTAVEEGRLVINVTQCRQGEVELGLYDVSAGLLSRGVVSGMDMTPEAALTKMFVVLGAEKDPGIAADRIELNMRGEQRLSIFHLHFPAGSFSEDSSVAVLDPIREMVEGKERYRSEALEMAVLRLTGLGVTGTAKQGIIQFRAFLDDQGANRGTVTKDNPHFLGEVSKVWTVDEGEVTVVLPIADAVREFVDNRHSNTLTLVNIGQPFQWKRADIACFANC